MDSSPALHVSSYSCVRGSRAWPTACRTFDCTLRTLCEDGASGNACYFCRHDGVRSRAPSAQEGTLPGTGIPLRGASEWLTEGSPLQGRKAAATSLAECFGLEDEWLQTASTQCKSMQSYHRSDASRLCLKGDACRCKEMAGLQGFASCRLVLRYRGRLRRFQAMQSTLQTLKGPLTFSLEELCLLVGVQSVSSSPFANSGGAEQQKAVAVD